ncbi:hypothetical protein HOLleu_05842 [Holothuria leucospilota]|uniref:Endonuclease-reverse transcriptase n=1 Tax=Holothuria leucospilota TaxID=206669 RepID=A0A9Q1HII7_HOLLE|nr:hypothetical protein HOLleu_05842 [Holothuria leucospilota]
MLVNRLNEDKELNIRVNGELLEQLKDVLTSKKIKLSTRKRIVRCFVLSTVIYASETWTSSRDAENKIDAFEMWLYRKMLKVSYKNRISNEEVLNRVKAKKKLLSELKNRKLQYMGHILRSSGLQKQLLEGKVGSRRLRGRPRNTWWADIRKWTGKSLYDLARMAEDRTKWRTMASRASKGQGTT